VRARVRDRVRDRVRVRVTVRVRVRVRGRDGVGVRVEGAAAPRPVDDALDVRLDERGAQLAHLAVLEHPRGQRALRARAHERLVEVRARVSSSARVPADT
jgi:hypothetical protein